MYTVRFEDKKINTEDGAFLKDCLAEQNYDFSCEGCRNKCVIRCPQLAATDLDKRLLTAEEIAQGNRLVCDKKVVDNLVIKNISMQKKDVPRHVLFSCDLVISIEEDTIDLAIVEGEKIVEQKSVDHPLSIFNSYAEQFSAYQADKTDYVRSLRKALIEECKKLLSLYKVTEAGSAVVCANGLLLRILFGLPLDEEVDDFNSLLQNTDLGLPAKNIYILPPVDALVSGKLFCRSVTKKDNVFLVDYGKNTTVLYIDKETDTYAYMWDTDRSFLSLLALRACLRVLRPEGYTPIVYLYGENAYYAEEILSKEGLTYVHAADELDCVALSLSPAFRSKLFKEQKRTSFHNLLKDETFQDQLTLLQEDMETE